MGTCRAGTGRVGSVGLAGSHSLNLISFCQYSPQHAAQPETGKQLNVSASAYNNTSAGSEVADREEAQGFQLRTLSLQGLACCPPTWFPPAL